MVNKSNKLTRSAEYLCQHEGLFACPICESPMRVINLRSLTCSNQHTFDIAKQGYINLLLQQNKTHYDKDLFTARRQIIAKNGFFDRLTAMLSQIINNQTTDQGVLKLVDMGSGEGTHLANIDDTLQTNFTQSVVGIGIDIAKEGILTAAKSYENVVWMVADLAHTPLMDQTCDVILNILSPSNYREFKRVLKDDGIVIKVVPGEGYLSELRHHFYQQSSKEDYSNVEVTTHFSDHFHHVEEHTLFYKIPLDPPAMKALIKMTPLTWNISEEEINTFLKTGISEITVDLKVLIGKK